MEFKQSFLKPQKMNYQKIIAFPTLSRTYF